MRAVSGGGGAEAVRAILRWHGLGLPAAADLAVQANLAPERLEAILDELAAEGKAVRLAGDLVLEREPFAALKARILGTVERLHRRFPSKPALPVLQLTNELGDLEERLRDAMIARLVQDGSLRESQGALALPDHTQKLTGEEIRIREAVREEHEKRPFTPEGPQVLADRLRLSQDTVQEQLNLLVEEGELVRIAAGVYFRREALDRAGEAARRLAARVGAFAVMDFRDELGTSRKYAVPILEYLDARRVTVRRPDSKRVVREG
jgi:selenocysteine-specific elongation factor